MVVDDYNLHGYLLMLIDYYNLHGFFLNSIICMV